MQTDRPVAAEPRRPLPLQGNLPWLLLVALSVGTAVFLLRAYQPLLAAKRTLQQQHGQTQAELAENSASLATAMGLVSTLEAERDALKRELLPTRQANHDDRSDLKTLLSEIEQSLQRDLADGGMTILARGEHRGVRIREDLLFVTGTTRLTAAGRKRLSTLAHALLQLPNQAFRVAGHVDQTPAVPPIVRQAYPTNWDLSSARAIRVVRHLHRVGQVPAAQLVAAAFGDQLPITDEATGNGRIEITLMGRRPLGSTAEDVTH
jgi:chemotaxis protein MotB